MVRAAVKKMRVRKAGTSQGKGFVDIAEEAIHLLRRTSFSTLACYYIGSLPFLLALLYFWTDMSHSAYADERCVETSFGLAVLFVWMKCWHSIFAQRLKASLHQIHPSTWSSRRVLRLVIAQTIIQPWGMLLLPLAMIVTLPFPWLYAFYQNVTVFGGQDDEQLKSLSKRAWQQARLWPKQNSLLIWLLSPWLLMTGSALLLIFSPFLGGKGVSEWLLFFMYLAFLLVLLLSPLGTVVAANLSAALLLIPWMLKTFLGIETVFSLSFHQMLNSTFFALVCGLSYLCLDPLVKAVYVLRCFYGEALQSGEDLKVELRQISAAQKLGLTLSVLLIYLLTIFSPHAEADERRETGSGYVSSTAMSPVELDDSLQDVLSQPEYAWRMAREREYIEHERTLPPFLLRIFDTFKEWGKTIGGWFKKVGEWFGAIGKWFRKLFPRDRPEEEQLGGRQTVFDLGTKIQLLLYVLLAGIACVAALLFWRNLRDRKLGFAETEVGIETPEPDLTEEEVDAGQLPPDEWLTLAQSFIERGDVRLALRALYLAGLACLAEHHLLTIAKYKSDRDYEKELQRRSHAFPALPSLFHENMRTFQRSWYGLHEVSREMLEQVSANYESLKNLVATKPEAESL